MGCKEAMRVRSPATLEPRGGWVKNSKKQGNERAEEAKKKRKKTKTGEKLVRSSSGSNGRTNKGSGRKLKIRARDYPAAAAVRTVERINRRSRI